jgi:hypothetical protein
VTDIRVESGAESDSLSWRFGETEKEPAGARPAWRENPRDTWFRDSHFTDYKITNTPYGKDVLRMLVDAFRAEGLRVICNF